MFTRFGESDGTPIGTWITESGGVPALHLEV
jgi:hypothetical protein